MWSVDETMKRIYRMWMAVSFIMLFVACEEGEQTVLGELKIDSTTCNTISCHVEVVEGMPDECLFYYATTKKAAEKNRADYVKGVYDGAVVNGTIDKLKPNTTYYIRACAINGFGRTSTETVSTKTPPRVPAMGDNNYPTID